MRELVTVIMSTYNEELLWVEESIESIINQTYNNIEFIIVLDNPDNNSINDLVWEYSNKDSRIIVVENEINLGLTASLNKALLLAKGEYVARMDADDIAELDRLEKQYKYIVDNDLDFVFSAMTIVDQKGKIKYKAYVRPLSTKAVKSLIRIGNVATHPTWFLKKSVYDALDGYREVPFCEDYDFVLRGASLGFKIGRMPNFLVSYRVRNSSISNRNGLEQFLNAKGVRKLYNQKKLNDLEALDEVIKKSKESLTDSKIIKFTQGSKLLKAGINEIKSKRIFKGVFIILKSCAVSPSVISSTSNWFRFKFVEYIFFISSLIGGRFSSRRS